MRIDLQSLSADPWSQEGGWGCREGYIPFLDGRESFVCVDARVKTRQSGPFKCVCFTVRQLLLSEAIKKDFSTGETIRYLTANF